MKSFPFLIPLLLLISCAHQNKRPVITEPENNALKEETLYRYNSQDLEKTSVKYKKLALCHKGEYNKALEQFKNSLDQDKNNPHYWNQLGICYLLKEEYPKGQFYLGIAMNTAKAPHTKALILNNLGLIQLRLKNFPEAKEFFMDSIKYNSQALTPKFNLAMLYSKFGLVDKSKSLFLELNRINPKDPDIKYQLAHIELLKSNFLQAKKYFEKIPKKYLRRDDILTNYASTLYFLGENKKALQILKAAPMKMSSYIQPQVELINDIEETEALTQTN